jgi:predicted lipoprotein with Yx(FWY)xxD motif
MKYLNQLSLAGLAFTCILLIQSCNRDEIVAPSVQPTIQLKSTATLSNFLADSMGNTLYYFSNDFDGKSSCTGGCLNIWPIYYAGDNLSAAKLPAGIDIADFGTITTAAGAKQTTYKTWPLYYYAPLVDGVNKREGPNETGGDGFNNIWFVAKSDYSIMQVNAQLVGKNGKNYKSDYTEGTGKTLYFSDMNGVTLYAFSPDNFNVNKFTKPDFSNNAVWPIYETDKVVVPSNLDKTLFSSITVYGKKQLTYKGWPMYYFGADSMRRGLNQGVSFPAPAVWPVIVKDAPNAPR